MLIYMDICCFNRPFDDQSQQRIYLETEAKLFIQESIKAGKYKLVWSYILDYENSANPDNQAMETIMKWERLAYCILTESESIVLCAEVLHKKGFGVKDALHLSCALAVKADYFITVDKGILKKKNTINGIRILSPLEFIEMEE